MFRNRVQWKDVDVLRLMYIEVEGRSVRWTKVGGETRTMMWEGREVEIRAVADEWKEEIAIARKRKGR